MFYSPSINAFYTVEIHATMPVDVVEITPQTHAQLMADQGLGKRIQVGANGQPVAVFPPVVPLTQEQARDAAKDARSIAVAAIKVTTQAGHAFDGDEISQGRMARAIIALQATGTASVTWVLADNTAIQASAAELSEALAMAGAAQAALWVLP